MRLRKSASQRWLEGRILRPTDALLAGGGSAFEVQNLQNERETESERQKERKRERERETRSLAC